MGVNSPRRQRLEKLCQLRRAWEPTTGCPCLSTFHLDQSLLSSIGTVFMSLLTLAPSMIKSSLVYLLSSVGTVFMSLFTLAPSMIKSSLVYFRVDFNVLLLHRREARSWATSWPSRLAVTHTLTPSMCYMLFIVQMFFMLSWWVYTCLCLCLCTYTQCVYIIQVSVPHPNHWWA